MSNDEDTRGTDANGPDEPDLMGVGGRCAITSEGKLLMLRRAGGDDFEPGRWELPGGKADLGEPLVVAVAREVKEETALVVHLGRPFCVWNFAKPPYWVTGVGFLCEHWDGTVALSDEHDEFAWVTMNEAMRLPLSTGASEQIEGLVALGSRAVRSRGSDAGLTPTMRSRSSSE